MATLLSAASVAPTIFESAPPLLPKEVALAIATLATAVFLNQESGLEPERGKLVAFTSPTSGEGVSTITSLLALQLARNPGCRVFLASPAQLGQMYSTDPENVKSLLHQNAVTRTWSLEGRSLRSAQGSGRWATQATFRRDLLNTLRELFDYLLLDCPAIDESPDVAELAKLADGVLLVVAAGCSSRTQILRAQQTIEIAGGKLEGCCLNRQIDPTPQFISRLLGR